MVKDERSTVGGKLCPDGVAGVEGHLAAVGVTLFAEEDRCEWRDGVVNLDLGVKDACPVIKIGSGHDGRTNAVKERRWPAACEVLADVGNDQGHLLRDQL